MSNLMKRAIAMLLVLASCICFIPAVSVSASAADVSYVYDGETVYNWGTRGEVANFLSPNAEKFYDSNLSYDELSAYSGGTGKSDAPNSALYRALKDVMVGAHSYVTSYNATRSLFQYTDCEGSGGKISSFYSGKKIGPGWDGGSSWNREHTWPNSKGLGGSDEDDIMMLRPTSTSENSSRGNTAYGESAGYYHPNSESGGNYDLRGDVARIFLYVYVRWGNVGSTAWGSGGVMESVDVLLEWIEEDPVDTWELGRNDSVESITGTRNVFVDYPELAFLLFGEKIPDDMTTPSGYGNGDCGHGNFDTGTVFLATCTEKGYTLYTCQTQGCGYSYKGDIEDANGHKYSSGFCTVCGEAEPSEPEKPTYATEIVTGKAYKLGLYSSSKKTEYYFNGAMSGYYGATDTNYQNAVGVYAESVSGGYHLYFNDQSGKKQYINLVKNDTHFNFTYGASAVSVFAWDTAKYTFSTTVSGEKCYIGTYGEYVTVGVLRSSQYKDTDYVARMYEFGGGEDLPDEDVCEHSYVAVVTAPGCLVGGFTTYTCSLCADSYVSDRVEPSGHSFVGEKCSVCGAEKVADTKASISFAGTSNRTQFTSSLQIWAQNGITVTNEKASSQSDVADYSNPARFYKGSSVTIEYPGITRIEINCKGLADKYVSGWLNAPSGSTATNNGGVITVTFASAVDSVTYTSLSAQCRAYDITVYGAGAETAECPHANVTVEGAIAPTCAKEGHTGKTVCLDCDEILSEGQVISVKAHSFRDADCDTPKTCADCGATEGTALGHSWIAATTESPKRCDRCGITEGDKLPEDEAPGGEQNPGASGDNQNPGENPDGDTPGGSAQPDKDHTKCEGSFFEELWNAICNFFIMLFGGKEKCICGEYLD